MASAADVVPTFSEFKPRHSEWKRIIRVFYRRKLALIGLVIILLLIAMAIFAPLLAPYDPYETDLTNSLAPQQ